MKKLLLVALVISSHYAQAELVDVLFSGPKANNVPTVVINNYKSTPVTVVGNKGAVGTICLWVPAKKKWNCLQNNRTIPTGATAILWNTKPTPLDARKKSLPFYQKAAKGHVFVLGGEDLGWEHRNLGWDKNKVAIKVNAANTLSLNKNNIWVRDKPTQVTLTDYGVSYSQLDTSTDAPSKYPWGNLR